MGGTPQLLGDRIRARREELELMPVDLAREAGVSISAVLQWENNKTKNLKLEYFFAIADLLKVEPRWLGLGVGSKEVQATPTLKRRPQFQGAARREGTTRAVHKSKKATAG